MAENYEDPGGIFGPDSLLPATSSQIKIEKDLISNLPACPPSVKLESMSVSDLQQHLLQKKENIAKMNDEVLAIENKLLVADPINTSNDLNMSQNLLLEPSQVISGIYDSSESFHGSKENPVTLSSSDDEQNARPPQIANCAKISKYIGNGKHI